MKRPELPASVGLVIVRPGSPETAGTRYLGLTEALDRTRGAQLHGLVTRRRPMPEREKALDGARVRALQAAADHGFGWRPRQAVCQEHGTQQVVAMDKLLTKPFIRLRLNFTE